jgi:hypothetical protein
MWDLHLILRIIGIILDFAILILLFYSIYLFKIKEKAVENRIIVLKKIDSSVVQSLRNMKKAIEGVKF